MLESLLYVSKSRIQMPQDAHEVTNILEVARSRNDTLNVTGALVFTEARFAQVLEGPRSSLDELMASISIDGRHQDVNVITIKAIEERRFQGWSLAYSGPSIYVDRHIKPLLGDVASQEQKASYTQRLIGLMHELVTP